MGSTKVTGYTIYECGMILVELINVSYPLTGKAARTGAMPGVTRSVEGTIKVFENPTVYLIDTPGMFLRKWSVSCLIGGRCTHAR